MASPAPAFLASARAARAPARKASVQSAPASVTTRPAAARMAAPSPGEELDRRGVALVLDGQDTIAEHRLAVPRAHGNGALDDDRAVVRLLVDEVDGHPRDLDPVVERLALCVEPCEGGQEGGVDV